ncbi:hypothetical protein [Salinibacter altiplanensis]|uniref:hypothetical protein n=1 Tax=Salinibacter altiplanensis TaxID=1803181 RepID=UPI0018F877D8|nr:hypothetical protein [Salinibacter altiplanensis]
MSTSSLQFEVISDLPKWCLPNSSVKSGFPDEKKDHHAVEVPVKGPYFYIDADISQGWPHQSQKALCKLGVTGKSPAVRCTENQKDLYRKWGVEADLDPVFIATGRITTAEKEIVDYTLGWLPNCFQKNAEWRHCPPRELARTALLIAEKGHRSSGASRKGAGQKAPRDRNEDSATTESTTQQARRRRLSAPGTTVHLEPAYSGRKTSSRETSGEATPVGEMPEGRPLREPMPSAGPSQGPSAEGPSDQSSSNRDLFSEDSSSQGAQAKLFPSEDFSSKAPSELPSGPGGFLAGEVPSKTGLAHRWLRQRALFAELRALEKSEAGRRNAIGSQEETDEGEITQVQVGKSELGRGEVLKLRLKPACAALLSEAVACSSCRGRSAFLRVTATGRDRRAPIIAKAGMLFFWTRRHFGKEISLGKETSSERNAGEALRALSSFLFGLQQVGEALALIRRHLRAAELKDEGRLEGDGAPSEQLPPVPETVQKRAPADLRLTVSVRVSQDRRRLIEENAGYSAYGDKSTYIRQMVLGWDRNARVRTQCAAIAEWMESCWEERNSEGHSTEVHPRMQIGLEDWRRLDELFRQRFGVFLAAPGPTGKADVEGALRRGTRHLLGADPETFAARVPAAL